MNSSIFFLITISVVCFQSFVTAQYSLNNDEKEMVKSDITFLTNGVKTINGSGFYPADIIMMSGKYVYPLASTQDNHTAVWAAARVQYGKICFLTENTFCNMNKDQLASYDNARMLENCIHWISNKSSNAYQLNQTGLITTDLQLPEGFVKSASKRFDSLNDLSNVSFAVLDDTFLSSQSKKVEILQEFVKNGGGLLICSNGWPEKEGVVNELLIEFGLMARHKHGTHQLSVVNENLFDTWWTDNLWYYRKAVLSDTDNSTLQTLFLKYTELALKFAIENESAEFLLPPANKIDLFQIYDKVCKNRDPLPGLLAQHIFSATKGSVDYACIELIESFKYLFPLNENHPITKVAEYYPGRPSGNRTNNTISVTVRKTHTGWESAGIYVWPGSWINVSVPNTMTNGKFYIVVGCHKSYKEELVFYRWPVLNVWSEMLKENFSFFSFYGGLFYINIGELTNEKLEPFTITLSGNIVSAPLFILDKTSEDEWRKSVSETMSPWAEIESNSMIVSFPMQYLYMIKNVTKLAEWYDVIINKTYNLYSSPRRMHKERVITEFPNMDFIGHSGYPMVITHDYIDQLLFYGKDVSRTNTYVETSHWLLFHEIGHNFDKGGITEYQVTNEILCLYIEEYYPDGPNQFGQRNYYQQSITSSYPADNLLTFYIHLRQAFGWIAIRQFYHLVENSSTTIIGKDTKEDIWLRYFSSIVKRDISYLLTLYNKSFSTEASSYASQFPSWNISTIVDCRTVAFPGESPCATVELLSGGFVIEIVTWVRINYTDALEIRFPTKEGDLSTTTDIESAISASEMEFEIDNANRRIRANPKNWINAGDKISITIVTGIYTNTSVSYSNVLIKIINLSSGETLHVQERSVEAIYYAA